MKSETSLHEKKVITFQKAENTIVIIGFHFLQAGFNHFLSP
jgi:hypothetical protein